METAVYWLYLQYLQRLGVVPFSEQVNYMSLEGLARLFTFWLTGVWV